MKLKQLPDDFHVEELTDALPGRDGSHSFYRLRKTNWTTPDALAAVRRRWNVHPGRMHYGGLKDRHAVTVQYVSIDRGPRRPFEGKGFGLEYLGQLAEPYTSRLIRANLFRITLRDWPAPAVPAAERALAEVRRDGVPNYFDDQRFGSVVNGEFVARHLCFGRFEAALKLALAGPYEFDRAEQKRDKQKLRDFWGQWDALAKQLGPGHERSIVAYLKDHPDDFRGAIERLRPDLQGLYLSAYQSHLWNAMLAEWLTTALPPGQWSPVKLRLGYRPFHRQLTDDQRSKLAETTLPLPSARLDFDASATWAGPLLAALDAEGLTLDQMRVPGVRKPFFSRGDRPALSLPENLTHAVADDELHTGRKKLLLSFALGRGSYATLVVKRVQHAADRLPADL